MKLRRAHVCVGIVALLGLGGSVAGAEDASGSRPVVDFELGSTGGVVDFTFSYPKLLIPYVIRGGVLESSAVASGLGRAQGLAGIMPIPIASSAGLLVPDHDPITGQPIPPEVQKAVKAMDYSAFPNACQSEYPGPADAGERYCGGPASEDARLGFTADVANGHTRSSGQSDDGLQARGLAESHVVNATVPALQMTIQGAASKAVSGMNANGIPEARAVSTIDSLSFLAGLVRIEGLHSESVAVSDGTEHGTAVHSQFNVRGVWVAGIPVVVSRDGVSAGKNSIGAGGAVPGSDDEVNKVLRDHDLQIHLLPQTEDASGHETSAQSAGIEIVHRGSSVTPADSVYRFGFTSVRANAVADTPAAASVPGVEEPAIPSDRGGAAPPAPGPAPAADRQDGAWPPFAASPPPVQTEGAGGATNTVMAAPVVAVTHPQNRQARTVVRAVSPRRLPVRPLHRTLSLVALAAISATALLPARRVLSRLPS